MEYYLIDLIANKIFSYISEEELTIAFNKLYTIYYNEYDVDFTVDDYYDKRYIVIRWR